MSKMTSSEANEIFFECERVLKRLKQENSLVTKALKNNNKSEYSERIEAHDILVPLVNFCLESATDASERAGWWKKKIARTYLVNIPHEYKHLVWGLDLLGK